MQNAQLWRAVFSGSKIMTKKHKIGNFAKNY